MHARFVMRCNHLPAFFFALLSSEKPINLQSNKFYRLDGAVPIPTGIFLSINQTNETEEKVKQLKRQSANHTQANDTVGRQRNKKKPMATIGANETVQIFVEVKMHISI